MNNSGNTSSDPGKNPVVETFTDKIIFFCIKNKFVLSVISVFILVWAVMVAPFDWNTGILPRFPVAVDAIPDIGENQQIVFTEWPGRSPQDVEDQISYPLTTALLGVPGIKTIRSYSMFGFSTVYIIFDDNIEFYWSRSRVLEKLSSLPANSLPENVRPALGPDATALGQVYWYTIEGRDARGEPTGGWDLHELRTIQDWYVRYALQSVEGVSEVASIGGFVQEYQIDVSPGALRAHQVKLEEVFNAVRNSNADVGARTIEVNKVEYVIRGRGLIKSLEDIENTVIKVVGNTPVYIKNVANVVLGPALRRGALDKNGAEATGGVVVVRYGDNPMAAIKRIEAKIVEITPGMPEKVLIDYDKTVPAEVREFANQHGFNAYADGGRPDQQAWMKFLKQTPHDQWPEWVTLSKATIVPFYNRTSLINETLGTLNKALIEEILVTVIVILILLMHFRSSLVISLALPMSVLMCFIAMKTFRIDANIVALSGIAIAIGTIVDMSIIVCENIIRHLSMLKAEEKPLYAVYNATREVSGAVITAVLTTIVSFLPVFTMIGPEGKLFKPLAFTNVFALAASILIALTIVPALAHFLFSINIKAGTFKLAVLIFTAISGVIVAITISWWAGAIIVAFALFHMPGDRMPAKLRKYIYRAVNIAAAFIVLVILARHWQPLGPGAGFAGNLLVAAVPIAGLLIFFMAFRVVYAPLLRWILYHKLVFMILPLSIILAGVCVWLGFGKVFGWMPDAIKSSSFYVSMHHRFPGLGKEFMPDLDEGSFLYMPTTMPHASIGEAMDVMRKQNIAINAIPEVIMATGKIGRAETPLDPAPVSMIETVINYSSEYITDPNGNIVLFKHNSRERDLFRDEHGNPVNAPDGTPYYVNGKYQRDKDGKLIPDHSGRPFRLWRPALDPTVNPDREAWRGIRNPDDIWDEIIVAAEITGTTSAPKLQPIAARVVMLQSGMRAPMGVKVKGADLPTIEKVCLDIEKFLKDVPGVEPNTVFAERIIGKPYLEINIDRTRLARYGIMVQNVQNVIEVAIGGKTLTTTIEGRERYPVRVRYMRELRDQIHELENILVAAPNGQQIPLGQLADISYSRGPQMIKGEDTFLVGYVLFDKESGHAEVDVVERAQAYLEAKISSNELIIPGGVSYTFAGNYENQIRAARTLMVVLPLSLLLIFMILYLQFKSTPVTALVFSAIAVAWSGGFILIWLYGQDWFLNFSLMGRNMRELFQIREINLSVAVWVGFLALFGIASDDGVVICTYLKKSFSEEVLDSLDAIRDATVRGASLRIRPCLMTSATTILALLPVLTSTGRGSDIMIPMAIPVFGGMLVVLISSFVVPVLYCGLQEITFRCNFKKIQ